MPIYFKDVHPEDSHLVEIGDYCFVSICSLQPKANDPCNPNGCIRGKIIVGDGCSIGLNSVISGNVVMEEGAAVGWYTHVKGGIESPLMIEKETVVLGDKRLRRRNEALKQIEKQQSARTGCSMGSKIADVFASLVQHSVRYVGIWAVYEVSYEINSYIKDDNIGVMAFALYSLLW
eukprot:CAMPEP_0185279810 /NCGR_PEP_ID=MMETSP1359-20130426/64453_1 /TAXON_ID=552665 /ORGANISM="Bigelowiella longifila, Strain CCMP242" /LENGTH=175 /DNA_ID=CAMNT_0027874809 /DNA_START=563 /DNA_END=1087 /DNA_ORIENTATION=+